MEDPKSAEAQAQGDSGCLVDWSWLEGRQIASATSNLDKLDITFDDGQTLSVKASLWKGQPFLAFNPWKPRKVIS